MFQKEYYTDKTYYPIFKKKKICPYSADYNPFDIIEDAVHRRILHPDARIDRPIVEDTGVREHSDGRRSLDSSSIVFNIYQTDEGRKSTNEFPTQTKGNSSDSQNICFNITNNTYPADKKYHIKKSKRRRGKKSRSDREYSNESHTHVDDESHTHEPTEDCEYKDETHTHEPTEDSEHKDDFSKLMKHLYKDIGEQLEQILKYYVQGSDELNDLIKYDTYADLADKLYVSRSENNELFEQYRLILIDAITGVKNNNDREKASKSAYEKLLQLYEQLKSEKDEASNAMSVSESLDTTGMVKHEITEYLKRGYKLVDERGSIIPLNMDVIAQIRNEIACNRLLDETVDEA